MTAVLPAGTADAATVRQLVADFLTFLQTGVVAQDLFAREVFGDVSMPIWRLQAGDRDGLVQIRRSGHPAPGRVSHHRADPIPGGFVLEFTETWDEADGGWMSREMVRADVRDGRITELSVYCTGDWSPSRIAEHAAAVTLLRP